MNLLFIFTGGTIGSAVSGDYITTDDNMPYELLEAYRKKYGFEHSYNVMTPYTVLSEYNTGVTISKLIRCVSEVLGTDKCAYDGIIITHGTDTLPYSAAALAYALGNKCIPVCLVSSNYPITDLRANGVDNLHGAIRLFEENVITETYTGVFASYRNHDGVIYIHRASRLIETMAFSDEYFSVNNMYYGSIIHDKFKINENYSEQADELAPIGCVQLTDLCEDVLRYHLFPGISLEYMKEDKPYKCILIEGFHSGTMNTTYSEYQRYYEEMYKKGIPVYLCGLTEGISYESTSLYEKLHIKPIYDVSPVAAYMKIWMLMAADRKCDEEIINSSLGGDI